MYYVLSTKIQGADTASGTAFQKIVLKFVVKILNTNKGFLKIPF